MLSPGHLERALSPTISAGAILSLYKTFKFFLEQRLEGGEQCPCFEPKEFVCERNYIQPNDDDGDDDDDSTDKIKILIIQVLPGVIFLTDIKS